MTLREIINDIDFDEWAKRKSRELFGENPEYIRSLFYPVYRHLLSMAGRNKGQSFGTMDVSEDGLYVKYRINDVPLDKLLDVECRTDVFDLVMWELARSGRKWK